VRHGRSQSHFADDLGSLGGPRGGAHGGRRKRKGGTRGNRTVAPGKWSRSHPSLSCAARRVLSSNITKDWKELSQQRGKKKRHDLWEGGEDLLRNKTRRRRGARHFAIERDELDLLFQKAGTSGELAEKENDKGQMTLRTLERGVCRDVKAHRESG